MSADADNNSESGSVGVITAIEDVDGEMVDMSDVDQDTRGRWIDQIADQLCGLDGVADVDGYGRGSNFQEAYIYVTLESEKRYEKFDLQVNLRSIAQRIRHTLSDNRFVSFSEILEKPEKTGSRSDCYTTDQYMISVSMP